MKLDCVNLCFCLNFTFNQSTSKFLPDTHSNKFLSTPRLATESPGKEGGTESRLRRHLIKWEKAFRTYKAGDENNYKKVLV